MEDKQEIKNSFPYQIYASLFKHRLASQLPIPWTVYQQDNILELCFQARNGDGLKLIINFAYIRDKKLPTTFIFTEFQTSKEMVKEGDLLDNCYFDEIDSLLNTFQQ